MSATTVTSRGSGQSPKDARTRPPTSHPYPSTHFQRSGRTPSISPLSQTSKTYDTAMAENTNAGSPTPGGRDATHKNENGSVTPNNIDSRDRSSSLSDIEGSIADQENEGTLSDSPSTPTADDDDDDAESEAETERVEPTPHKGGNPAKLSMGAHLHTLKEDPASDTDSVKAGEEWDMSRPPAGLAGRKRKRTLISQDAVAMVRSDDSDSDSGNSKKRGNRKLGGFSAGEQIERELLAEAEEQADGIDRVATPDLSPSKTGRNAKGKGRSHKKQIPRVQETIETELEEPEEPEIEVEEETAAEDLAPEEAIPRTESRGNASGLRSIFSSMRSQIYGDRIKQADQELEQLALPNPEHIEYLAKLQAITDRRDLKIQQEMKLLQYKKETLRISTLAHRSQLLSQYFQDAREIREERLYDLGELFYNIQKERRLAQSEELDQFTTAFPTKRSDQVKHQAKYNTEVSVLSGIAKYVGFPAAPEIGSARPQELEDDMRAMRIAPRQPQPTYQAQRPQVFPAGQASDRAQKEFLEQTPWANPHHPVHAQSRTPSAFGHHGLGGQPAPSYGLLNRPASAFATPAGPPGIDQPPPGSNETIGAHSDPPSSAFAGPPTANRIQFSSYEQSGDVSPTSHVKRAPAARRDFSGLSSASTIDMPQDQPMDARAAHQPFLTSAYHGQASQT